MIRVVELVVQLGRRRQNRLSPGHWPQSDYPFVSCSSLRILDSSTLKTTLPLLQSTSCPGVSNSSLRLGHHDRRQIRKKRFKTHHRGLEAVLVHLELPHRLGDAIRPVHDLRNLILVDVPQYRLHLVSRRRLFGDVELEGLAGRGRSGSRLVRGLACVGGRLLQKIDDAGGGGGVPLVEERDDIEGFALNWSTLISPLCRRSFNR